MLTHRSVLVCMHVRQGRQVPGHVFGELARLRFSHIIVLCPVDLAFLLVINQLDEGGV